MMGYGLRPNPPYVSQRASPHHDDLGADLHAVVEVDHVVIEQAKTARRNRLSDRFGSRLGKFLADLVRQTGHAQVIQVAGQPGLAAMRVFERALDEGLLVRFAGDAIAVAPPFICSEKDIVAMVESMSRRTRVIAAS